MTRLFRPLFFGAALAASTAALATTTYVYAGAAGPDPNTAASRAYSAAAADCSSQGGQPGPTITGNSQYQSGRWTFYGYIECTFP